MNYFDIDLLESYLEALLKTHKTNGKRASKIIIDRFARGMTLQKIANKYGVTRERVRQISETGMIFLRRHRLKYIQELKDVISDLKGEI